MNTPETAIQQQLWSGGWWTLKTLARYADLEESVCERAIDNLLAQGLIETLEVGSQDRGFQMFRRAAVMEIEE